MPIAVVAAIAAVAGTVGSIAMQQGAASKQKKAVRQAQDAQRETQRIEQVRADASAQRERISQQREARIRRAQVLSSSQGAGIGFDSSGVQGATGSITSQFGANLGYINQAQGFANQISNSNQREQDAMAKAQKAQAGGQMWQSIFSGVSGLGKTVSGFGGGGVAAGLKAGGGNTFPNFFEK